MLNRIMAAVLLLLPIVFPAFAQTSAPAAGPAPATKEERQKELSAAFEAGLAAAVKTRSKIPLLSEAVLNLPTGYQFVPQPQAGRIMRALGSSPGQSLAGLVLPSSDDANWIVKIDFIAVGYVKDDEAKEWEADKLLASLREGTELGNQDRIARGFDPIEVVGWAEPPAYNEKTHRLVWAATARTKDKPESSLGVNYNTYALGRDGYFTLNLLTDQDDLPLHKIHSRTLLEALDYNQGKNYADFNPTTDNVAAYGITALVAGAVVAKKLGFLAIAAALIAKAGKLLVIGAAALLYGFRRLFGKRDGA